jgi:3-phenylpropionate/trans-cinnamate dioxygenase ferredoxin reductase subunit
MATDEKFVIIGAGQAAGRAVEAMRMQGFGGDVVIVGDEAYPPYERPPLSKQVLIGEDEPYSTYVHNPAYYHEHQIELRLGTRAEAIDRGAKSVSLSDGTTLSYTKLLLATGSKLRRLSLPGSDLAGIHYLRGIDDSLAIRAELTAGAKVAVVGGGYIGLEVAAAARKRDCQVTVIEMMDQLMSRAAAPEISAIFETIHRGHGVDIRTNTPVNGFDGNGHVQRVFCGDFDAVDADVVIVGIGILPNDELASAAGLATDNGVVVDEHGQTVDPDIYAAGDVTNHPNAILGRRIRLESWQNAQNQAIIAAKAMCGVEETYAQVPWFWSDQYDVNLQIVGLPEGWNEVVLRGDTDALTFTAFYLQYGCVVGANAVNSPRDIPIARQMIQRKVKVEAVALADQDTSLRKLLKSLDG